MSVTYSECFLTLVMHHSKLMWHAVLPPVVPSARPYVFTLSHTWHDCRKKKRLDSKCVFSIQLSSETFLILRKFREVLL
jgi:hypothetical protein